MNVRTPRVNQFLLIAHILFSMSFFFWMIALIGLLVFWRERVNRIGFEVSFSHGKEKPTSKEVLAHDVDIF